MQTGFGGEARMAMRMDWCQGQHRATGPGHALFPEVLAELGHTQHLARGQRLTLVSETDRNLGLIESGTVKTSLVTQGGKELAVGLDFAGDVIGLNLLGDSTQSAIATATEPTRVCLVQLALLQARSKREPFLQCLLLRLASERIAHLQQQMLMLSKMDARERVAAFLIELTARRKATDGGMQLPMSLDDIGCYLGLAAATVCRMLRHLEEEGVIKRQGRRMSVLEPERLSRIAGLPAYARPQRRAPETHVQPVAPGA